MIKKNNSGFTLLEIIIVIIIVGVLASLALPRFFATIEYSRSTEAFSAFTAIRQSLERCYLQNDGTYIGCSLASMDLEDPANSPNAHFGYAVADQSATGYTITAVRNTRDGGVATSTISLAQDVAVVGRSGATAFAGIQ